MQMEVMLPGGDFNFDSACTSQYVSATSSPQRFGNYFFSAPTSPTRATAFLHDSFYCPDTTPLSAVPFNWEEKPGIPKSKTSDDDTEFEFDFSFQKKKPSLSADELFDGGKIKPLKPPPGLQYTKSRGTDDSPRSPKSLLKEAFSPRLKKKDFDPFAAAMEETRKENPQESNEHGGRREGISAVRQKGTTRSLSPFRASDMVFERANNDDNNQQQNSKPTSSSNSSLNWYRKWKLKDLLLFRSASEGHKEYVLLKKTQNEDAKNLSFRSTDSGVSQRKKGRVSAHEWHYTVNRAAAEEMRRKTYLPYKRGLLGCLGFNPGVQEIARGIGSAVTTRE